MTADASLLVDPDDGVRGRALAKHQAHLRAARRKQTWAAYDWNRDQTIIGGLTANAPDHREGIPHARLVPQLTGTDLAERLTSLRDADDEVVRLRAGFLTDVSQHPAEPLNRGTWHRWLAEDWLGSAT